MSHRALLLNALGQGEARIDGLNEGADLLNSANCLRALGVSIVDDGDGLLIRGRGGKLRTPSSALHCGNSGTTMRLLAGLLAAQPFTATLDGDSSLRQRPMTRIAKPLRKLGARVEGPDHGAHPPLIVTGGALRTAEFELEVASAQLKSCILLAAAAGAVEVAVKEPTLSRDHTERMLASMGAAIESDGGWIRFQPGAELRCVDMDIPRDPSAAALLAAAACTVAGSQIQLRDVLLNPTRIAFFTALERMGVVVEQLVRKERAGEIIGDLNLRSPTQLRPLQISAEEVPSLLDEIPALAALAALAPGRSEFSGIAELRVKESDRIQSIEALCGSFGIATGSQTDKLWIDGGEPHWCEEYSPGDDHRMVMAAVALALGTTTRHGKPISITDISPAAVSFPDFSLALESMGVRAE